MSERGAPDYCLPVADEQGRHRGTPNPLEFPVGRWTLLALCAPVAVLFVFDSTGWGFPAGVGLFGISVAAFYRAAKLIKKGYPELDKDD